MPYRETFDADLDDRYQLHVVLQQQSVLGPWVVLGLGAILAGFVVYLIVTNPLASLNTSLSPERSLRIMPDKLTATAPTKKLLRYHTGSWRVNATITPRNRAANALLGGQGPALPPERVLEVTRRRHQWPPWSSFAEPYSESAESFSGSPKVAVHTLSKER